MCGVYLPYYKVVVSQIIGHYQLVVVEKGTLSAVRLCLLEQLTKSDGISADELTLC